MRVRAGQTVSSAGGIISPSLAHGEEQRQERDQFSHVEEHVSMDIGTKKKRDFDDGKDKGYCWEETRNERLPIQVGCSGDIEKNSRDMQDVQTTHGNI